ncbi:MAG: aminotransferase class I/II-fold pyridoxal phosphate-dependent enzyme [Magnetococcales bacterium]|nr:aminotransferase class I/II-fold pyridoxal phosphate-dependent enzyme [Magnetococcales bacterium]
MLKAYPRVWVDLRVKEVLYILMRLLNPASAASQKGVPEFERAFAELIGVKEAVAFTNCRSALYFSLKALNLEPGSEIIVPAFTFWIDPEVIVMSGHTPVFVDVDLETLNIDPKLIESAITPKTKAILATHLNGLPLEMDPIMAIAKKHKLRLIEDSARTCGGEYKGRRIGSYDIGCFSFGYGKSFYGLGGGMAVSNDPETIANLRKIQEESFRTIPIKELFPAAIKGCLLKFLNNPFFHGFTLFPRVKLWEQNQDKRYEPWFKVKKPVLTAPPDGYFIKMFDIQARLGLRQIRTLDDSNKKRNAILKFYNQALKGIDDLHLPIDPDDRTHVAVHYSVWSEKKDEMRKYLLEQRIDAQDESAQDVTQMARYAKYVKGSYPNANMLEGKVCYIPAHPCLNQGDITYIAEKIKEYFKKT